MNPGAPRKDIDWISFDGYCGLDASLEYCAEVQVKKWGQEVNKKTITAARKLISRRIKERFGCNFATYKDQRKEPRRLTLRQKMWSMVEKDNVTIMIWLSKQELGMREPYEPKPTATVNVDGKAEIVLKWTDEDNAGDASANAAPKTI